MGNTLIRKIATLNWKMSLLAIVCLLGFFPTLSGQEENKLWHKTIADFQIKPILAFQFWGAYTHGMEQYSEEQGTYTSIDDRLNFLIRRTRFGFQAQPYDFMSIRVVAAIDFVGRDLNSAFNGGANNASFPAFGLWDAYMQFRLNKHSEALYLQAGYFVPAFGLSSLNSAFQVNSMSKSFSQAYIRQHLVGRNPGRTSGLSLGGWLVSENSKRAFQYELGLHNPVFPSVGGNTSMTITSPLLVARTVIHFGDLPYKKYRRNGPLNFYNKRDGVSIGLSASSQGRTDIFTKAYGLGTDVVFNWGPINLNGEWYSLWRSNLNPAAGRFTYNSQTGYLRAGYNLLVGKKYYLEPSIMWKRFQGGLSEEEQQRANLVNAFAGTESTYDVGLNLFLNQHRLKVLLHYTWNEGNAGDQAPGSTLNQFFAQGGLGAIQRGSWLGLGVNVVL